MSTQLKVGDIFYSSWGYDHPGVSLGFGLFGYVVDIGIYDTRHKED